MDRVPVSTTVRAIVAVCLLAVFYVAGFALLAGLVWATVVLAGAVPDLAFATAAMAAGLVLPLWQIARARVTPPPGALVGEAQAPALWALVRDVAATVDTRAPDEIRLIGEVNAGVWEDAGRIGLRRGRRILYVGAPLLAAIDDRRLTAVLAHEMGHYAQGHTIFGAVVYRGGQSIRGTIERVGPRRAGGLVLRAFATLYFLVALTVMRSMEYAADRAAVRTAGAGATRDLLTSLPILVATWDDTLQRFVASAEDDGYDPVELIGEFVRADRSEAAKREPSPWDSHPPVADRLAVIDDAPLPDAADTRPAVDLLDDRGVLAAALDTDEFADRVVAAAYRRADEMARTLYDATQRVNGRDHWGLGGVLDTLGEGRGWLVTGRLSRPGRLADHVRAAIEVRLVGMAGAEWVHVWGEPLTLRTVDDRVIDLRDLIEAACADPARVTELRVRLRELGLGNGTVTSSASGWTGFDTSLVFRTLPGTAPSEPLPLLLPDRLFLLAHHHDRRRVPTDVLESGLAAAALAELRRRDRITLADGAVGTVTAISGAPTGDRFLDSVLARIGRGAPKPAYQWLQANGPEIAAMVRRRLGRTDYFDGDCLSPTGIAEAARLRAGLRTLLRAPGTDRAEPAGDVELLAMLLWATELTKPVFGLSAVAPRWFIGRLAARDPLMIGVRIVTGLSITMQRGQEGTGSAWLWSTGRRP